MSAPAPVELESLATTLGERLAVRSLVTHRETMHRMEVEYLKANTELADWLIEALRKKTNCPPLPPRPPIEL